MGEDGVRDPPQWAMPNLTTYLVQSSFTAYRQVVHGMVVGEPEGCQAVSAVGPIGVDVSP